MIRSNLSVAIREELSVAAPDVAPDAPSAAHFKDDLGVDSLALLEFVARLEFRFGIIVEDQDWQQLSSVDAVVDYLKEVLVAA